MALHGRPSPVELLEGAIASLRDVVLPAVEDPVAADRLRNVLAVLDHLRRHWDRAVADLVDEAEGIEAALAAAGAPAPEGTRGLGYDELASRVNRLHEGLIEAILAAERADAGVPTRAALPQLWAELTALVERRS